MRGWQKPVKDRSFTRFVVKCCYYDGGVRLAGLIIRISKVQFLRLFSEEIKLLSSCDLQFLFISYKVAYLDSPVCACCRKGNFTPFQKADHMWAGNIQMVCGLLNSNSSTSENIGRRSAGFHIGVFYAVKLHGRNERNKSQYFRLMIKSSSIMITRVDDWKTRTSF